MLNGDRLASNPYWSGAVEALVRDLDASADGLTADVAARRLKATAANALDTRAGSGVPALLLRQFTSPVVLLLIAAAVLSFMVQDSTDGAIILVIVVVSGLLGFWQEHDAAGIVAKLQEVVEPQTLVLRDGQELRVLVGDIVPGDVVVLSAGSGVPADCRMLASKNLFVDEATLTGETYPVEKMAGDLAPDTPLSRRTNALFMGTHVVSGNGRALVVQTGRTTEFGRVSQRLRARAPETEFERGVRRFGFFLMEVTLTLVLIIFAINVYLEKPVVDSFLFALALAVGLTPQLLPAIISVNLARGAKAMAAKRVIVKRLTAIENFGSMDVLCSDKTGTLTEGEVHVHSAVDAAGTPSDRVMLHAWLNATFQTGFSNPIDVAVRRQAPANPGAWTGLDEVPYDFNRKRLSVLVSNGSRVWLVSKGALDGMLDVCATAESGGGVVPLSAAKATIQEKYAAFSAQGLRTLGVAIRELPGAKSVRREDESAMMFLGLLVLDDPVKAGVGQAIAGLKALGVSLKIITGDNALVAAQVARSVGISDPRVITARELQVTSDEALPARAREADVFAEVEPNQKERIIRALRTAGHVVGYMGDGINDAPALHAADVGISVQQAVEVAKAAADIVLLEKDLAVLEEGVREGRRTFANTIKYVFMATSANFGNMFSMAGASLFLPFLPLLPKQILLTNLLTDIPELTISTDRVDAEWISRPHRWDVTYIRNFMVLFGILSSVFDYATFGVLLWVFDADATAFRTGWFLESVISATLIVLVVRTRRRITSSLPSVPLVLATAGVVAVTVALPFTPWAAALGFKPLPVSFVAWMIAIVIAYIVSAEVVKRWFFRRIGLQSATAGE